jgi:hypothetical protein
VEELYMNNGQLVNSEEYGWNIDQIKRAKFLLVLTRE